MNTKFFQLTLLLFFIITPLSAQLDTIWYDANWNVSERKQASYFRPPPAKQGNGYLLKDFYMSGALQMEAYSSKHNVESFDGEVHYFHENGNAWQIVNYKDSIIHGVRKIYYKNGPLESQYSYKNGNIEGLWVTYFENSKMSEEGNYVNDMREGPWKEYHKNGQLKGEGAYKEGKKVGNWIMHYYDGKLDDE